MSEPRSGGSGSERDAVESLEHLGLSNYEARVFVGLQKLGTGTARAVHDVTDVPRSQVYGAAESLEERGLIEIQQSTPKRYRPVSLSAARRQLEERLERDRERAFEYLDAVRREERGQETRDDVWAVRGDDPITDRTADLVARAESWVVFAAPDVSYVPETVRAALEERARAGVRTTVVSESEAVRDLFADTPVVALTPEKKDPPELVTRLVLADDEIVLLAAREGDDGEETAIWSAGTAMANLLTSIVRSQIPVSLDRE